MNIIKSCRKKNVVVVTEKKKEWLLEPADWKKLSLIEKWMLTNKN